MKTNPTQKQSAQTKRRFGWWQMVAHGRSWHFGTVVDSGANMQLKPHLLREYIVGND